MKKTAVKRTFITAVVLLMALVTACSSNNGKSAEETGPASKPASPSASAPAPSESQTIDPMAKYASPIEVTSVRAVNDTVEFPSGDSIDNNVWTRAYEQELGIKVKYTWKVNDAQYDQKMNVSIVSGDLPDIIPVNAGQLQQLVDGDLIMDLSELYEQYASPIFKSSMEEANGLALKAATFGGKLMAIPNTASAAGLDSVSLIWVRTDWLQKLGLPDPATMDDVIAIAKAFASQDPDGNDKGDTYGLNMNKDIYGGYAGVDGFFNGYHAYPGLWVKDSSGKLVYGSVQPEMREPLLKLQELYQAKAINPEFTVYDAGKSTEAEIAGKMGLHFGAFYNAMWPLGNTQVDNPDAQWGVFPLASSDGQFAKSAVSQAAPAMYYAINKKAKNPEAAFKLLNFYFEKTNSDNREPAVYHTVKEGDKSYEVHKFATMVGGTIDRNQSVHYKVVDAVKASDPAGLDEEEKSYYDAIKAYEGGDKSKWNIWRTFGDGGVFAALGKMKKDDLILVNEFYGAPTETMALKQATLKDQELLMITKIMLGGSIDEFDKFVDNWHSLGGDKITEEVNAWYTNKQ